MGAGGDDEPVEGDVVALALSRRAEPHPLAVQVETGGRHPQLPLDIQTHRRRENHVLGPALPVRICFDRGGRS